MQKINNQHFLPQSYMKRVLNINKNDSVYQYLNNSWYSKKIKKIHSNWKIYDLSQETADKFFGGDKLAIEKYFGNFETIWSKAIDNFDGTYPFEEYILFKEISMNFHYRKPSVSNLSKFPPEKPIEKIDDNESDYELINRVMNTLTRRNADKESGDIYLENLFYNYLKKRNNIKEILNDLNYEFIILNFEEELPMLNVPFQYIKAFEYKNKEKTIINWYKGISNHKVGILQISTKKWIWVNFNKKVFSFHNPVNRNQNTNDFQKNIKHKYLEFKELSISKKYCDELRYSLIMGGCFTRKKNIGENNTKYFFNSLWTGESGNFVGEVLEVEKKWLDKIINHIEKIPSKSDLLFNDIYNSKFDEYMSSLYKLENNFLDELLDKNYANYLIKKKMKSIHTTKI